MPAPCRICLRPRADCLKHYFGCKALLDCIARVVPRLYVKVNFCSKETWLLLGALEGDRLLGVALVVDASLATFNALRARKGRGGVAPALHEFEARVKVQALRDVRARRLLQLWGGRYAGDRERPPPRA